MSERIETFGCTNFGRVGKVELLMDGNPVGIETDGLDFKFKTSKLNVVTDCATAPSATVQILGLSRASVDLLCQFCDTSTYRMRNITAKVTAGYASGNISAQEIINMPVVRAIPSMPPDNWVTLTCMMFFGSDKVQSYTYSPEDHEKENGKKPSSFDLFAEIQEKFGIQFGYEKGVQAVIQDDEVTAFACNGGADDAIRKLRQQYQYLRFTQDPLVSSAGRPNYYHVYLNPLYKRGTDGKWMMTTPQFGNSNNTWYVDKEHGMIGMPSFISGSEKSRFVSVRTLLNPSYRYGDIISLKSDMSSGLNGNYHIRTVAHSGHLRGNEWYSDLEIFRPETEA